MKRRANDRRTLDAFVVDEKDIGTLLLLKVKLRDALGLETVAPEEEDLDLVRVLIPGPDPDPDLDRETEEEDVADHPVVDEVILLMSVSAEIVL